MNKLIASFGSLVIGTSLVVVPISASAADADYPKACKVKLNDEKDCSVFFNSAKSNDPIWVFSKPNCEGYRQRVWMGKNTSDYHPDTDWSSMVVLGKGVHVKVTTRDLDTNRKSSFKYTTKLKRTCFGNLGSIFHENNLIKVYDPSE